MVKKLRYLARFVVVCLLLKKSRQVRELIAELSKQIDDYVKTYDPEDQLEWQLVKNEINDFIDADSVLTINGGLSDSVSNRLSQVDVPPISPNPQFANLFSTSPIVLADHLSLQEILIVGNCNDQVSFKNIFFSHFLIRNIFICFNFKIKFSELSLDMYRMLQAVEREPSGTTDSNQLEVHNTKLLFKIYRKLFAVKLN